MNTDSNYLLLYRSIVTNRAFDDPAPYNKRSAVLDLMLDAELNGGKVAVSVRGLAARWGWPKTTVSRFLERLEKEGLIEVSEMPSGTPSGTVGGTPSGTLISFIHNGFNSPTGTVGGTPNGTPSGTPAEPEREKETAKEKEKEAPPNSLLPTTTERKKPPEEAKKESDGTDIPPSAEAVIAYCTERKSTVDPAKFILYYQANGWKVKGEPMKNWHMTIANWERRDREREQDRLRLQAQPPPVKKTQFHNYEERKVDYDELFKDKVMGFKQ